MSEVKRLIASMLGLLVGAAVGFAGIYIVCTYYEPVYASPTLTLLTIVVLGGGCAILGGYLGLLITMKIQKAGRAKRKQDKRKFVPKNKRK